MADSVAAGTATAAQDSARAKDTAFDQPSDAVKMNDMDNSKQANDDEVNKDIPATDSTSKGKEPATTSEPDPSEAQPDDSTPTSEAKGKQKALDPDTTPRGDSLTIDPAPDASTNPLNPTDSSPTQYRTCQITLLLATGARHPYRIDERYLTKREVEIQEMGEDGRPDPFSISVYKLKELILREWREDWEARPRDPSLIRLIHFGKLLDDKEQLKKYKFNEQQSNIVHMTIRPAEMVEEDEAAKTAGGNRVHRDYPRSGCCCVIL